MSSPLEIDLAAEDLLVRARRDELSDNERRKLRALLESSKELELLYLAGVELDRTSALIAGDEARMQRLVELGRAQARGAACPQPARLDGASASRRSSAPARTIAAALGLGAVLGATVSAAFQYGSQHFSRTMSVAPGGRAVVPVVAKPSQVPARPRPTAAAFVTSPVSSAAFPPVVALDPALQRAHGAPKRAADADASALFAKAAEARRNGDSATAIRLYERLCARYPNSVEAADARVSLGNLKLHQRSAAEALQHFENYPAGTLSGEALWGQAEALRQMSSPAERAALERILREYPDSSYATAARKRLENRP